MTRRSRRIALTVALVVTVGPAIFIAPISIEWFSKRPLPAPPGLVRLAAPFPVASDGAITALAAKSNWTGYADYQTIQIGRVERPARLFTGRRHWERQVTVPQGGARWEVVIGALDAPATVRAGRVGAVASETRSAADAWTRVSLDLDPSNGSTQTVAVDVEVASGGVAAWSYELVTPLSQRRNPPNIILISLDTVRRDQLTPYNPELRTTPVLDTFARDAVVFDRAVSTSSWTVASHSTLFTGHFPPDSLGYQAGVDPDELTLPEMFAGKGYRTFGVSGGPYTDPRWGLHQGFDEYVASGERENANDATSRAIDWMEKTGQDPVFVFLNYFDAHEPHMITPRVRHATGLTDDVENVPSQMWTDIEYRRTPITAAVRDRLFAAYRAELRSIDTELGRLFEYLQRTGRWDSTLVIVWGDHGQLLGERGSIGHAYTLEEELLRVPLIIKAPRGDRLLPGVYRHPIQSDDVFALCQTLAGLRNRDGAEIASAIRADAPFRRVTYSKLHHDPLPVLVAHPRWASATQWAVSDGQTKIVLNAEGRTVAYDLSGPEERPAPMPARDTVLVSALERFQRWSDKKGWVSKAGPLSPEEVERLRSLGYLR